jgi:hypothetical protein
MLSTTTEPFLNFLRHRLQLDDHCIPDAGEWADAGNTIGMLALRMNLLTVEQIDQILDIQENAGHGKLFGELAAELGFLAHEQVERLLAIQKLNRQLEQGARLVLAGRIDLRMLMRHLEAYVSRDEQA